MNIPQSGEKHEQFCRILNEAEAAFKASPKKAYAHMRKVATEKGADSLEYNAYSVAADDHKAWG